MDYRLKILAGLALTVAAVPAPFPVWAHETEAADSCEKVLLHPTWDAPVAHAAATAGAQAAANRLPIGQSAELALAPTPDIAYVLPPERPAGSVSYGGMVQFTAATAGRYRIAISTAAWIDLTDGQKSLESVKHGPGPDCSGVRKMVEFDLEAGDYLLQIIGNGAPSVQVLVEALPVQ